MQNGDARLIVLVQERAADQFMGAGQSFRCIVNVPFQIVEYLMSTFQAGSL